MSDWTAPKDLWEVNSRLQYNKPLEADDARWVDTGAARGQYSLRPLYRALAVKETVSPPQRWLKEPPSRGYYVFCGHRGCGKSTELRRIQKDLHLPRLYYVVFADTERDLDLNNLRYPDVLLYLAARLTAELEADGVSVQPAYFKRLENWFADRVEVEEEAKEFVRQARAGAQVQAGLPFVGKLFTEISKALKTNSSYKQVLRRTLQNYFTDFAEAFNHLIEATDEAVRRADKGQRILFVVDGLDRLPGGDAQTFFIKDVHQLQQVRGLFMYCAPIHLIYEYNTIQQSFTNVFKLPMIKVENADGSRNQAGWDAMRTMLHRRAPRELFDDGVADKLIAHSGGHPRDLLRLLQYAFTYGEHDRFDLDAARSAVRSVATELQRILNADDYELLARIDSTMAPPPTDDRTRDLLYNLALLEYNDYYWRSHPAIRTIDAYRKARGLIDEAGNG